MLLLDIIVLVKSITVDLFVKVANEMRHCKNIKRITKQFCLSERKHCTFRSLYCALLSLSYKRRVMPIITMFKRKLYVRPFDRFFRIAGLIKKVICLPALSKNSKKLEIINCVFSKAWSCVGWNWKKIVNVFVLKSMFHSASPQEQNKSIIIWLYGGNIYNTIWYIS